MKFTYPAVFHKTEQGTYEGYFPDLACCYAKGDTLDEALEDAIHSAYDWISLELTEEEPDFPPVSDVADLGKSEGEIARNIAVNIRLFEGWDAFSAQPMTFLSVSRLRSKKRMISSFVTLLQAFAASGLSSLVFV